MTKINQEYEAVFQLPLKGGETQEISVTKDTMVKLKITIDGIKKALSIPNYIPSIYIHRIEEMSFNDLEILTKG